MSTTNAASNQQLEPCGFCNARPSKTHTDWWFVRHERECFISIVAQRDMFIRADHIPIWNSRTTASPAAPKEEALVDEVQRRMDQVVDAAVEWHQTGLEGEDSFEAAEKLDTAINSLLELRSNLPIQNVDECFCGTELEAGLCPNGHDPITLATTPSPDAAREAAKEILAFADSWGWPRCTADEKLTEVAKIIRSHCFPRGGESQSE